LSSHYYYFVPFIERLDIMTSLSMKPILVVLTNSHLLSRSGGQEELGTNSGETHRTGFDIKEVAYIWLSIHKKMNVKVTFATPRGGEAPVDPSSLKEAEKDENIKDFIHDHAIFNIFKNTKPLDLIRPEEYSWILIPGGHGSMIDLPKSNKLSELINQHYEKNGYIAAIGHGAAALINVKSRNGEYLLKGKKVTCFTNEEEHELKYEKYLPYFLEDKVKERGVKFEKTKPFGSFVVMDQRLITAQNSYSIKDWINKIIEQSREHS
jgi:putative intracellular protease/amidase